MTTDGLFYALSRYDLRGFMIEPASVDPYLQRSSIRGGPNAHLQVGPDWERLMAVLPELADGVVVEGTPAMQCMVWPAGRVESGAQQLKALSASVFSERVQQWHAQQPSAANGIDVLDSLRQLVRLQAELRQFVDAAATRRDAMLLYAV